MRPKLSVPSEQSTTPSELFFIVFGVPVPQGSSKAYIPKGWNRAVITSDNSRLKPWRQMLSLSALDAMHTCKSPLIERPSGVSVEAHFFFERPKSAKKQVHKTTKPDVDKLVRSLFDSLTGIAFEDDSQVCESIATKAFGSPARVEVRVRRVEKENNDHRAN